MRKTISALLLALTLAWAMPSKAQLKFGVVAGLNLSEVSFKETSTNFDSNNRAGWYIGPKVEFTVPLIGIGADISLQYNQRKLNAEAEGNSTSKTLRSFEIPVNIRYQIGVGELAAVYVATGPQFGFPVGAKDWASSYQLKKSNVTWNVGAGVKLLGHLQAGLGYNFAISKFGKGYEGEIGSFKTNTWQLQLGYMF